MSSDFKHNKSKKYTARFGRVIVIAITLVSMFSSFEIYKPSFADVAVAIQVSLAFFCVLAVEGCFIWLLNGLRKAFTSPIERFLAYGGVTALLFVMTTNVVTHGMQSKGYTLSDFQNSWLEWGAYLVLTGILLLVVAISFADSAVRLVIHSLRDQGESEEAILRARSKQRQAISEAQSISLDSDRVKTAMQHRAESEAEKLAAAIEGEAYILGDEEEPNGRARSLNGNGHFGHPVFASKASALTLPSGDDEIVSVDDIDDRVLTGAVTRNKPPRLGGGFFFRSNGAGWDLRRNVYDGNGVRKQPHISHLSSSKWKEMCAQNRTPAGLKNALREWLFEAICDE